MRTLATRAAVAPRCNCRDGTRGQRPPRPRLTRPRSPCFRRCRCRRGAATAHRQRGLGRPEDPLQRPSIGRYGRCGAPCACSGRRRGRGRTHRCRWRAPGALGATGGARGGLWALSQGRSVWLRGPCGQWGRCRCRGEPRGAPRRLRAGPAGPGGGPRSRRGWTTRLGRFAGAVMGVCTRGSVHVLCMERFEISPRLYLGIYVW